VRVNITLAEDLLRHRIPDGSHSLTRSGFLAQAAKRQMDDEGNVGKVKGYALSA
jgi:hypothetical protein